jgi:VWFA-related protein
MGHSVSIVAATTVLALSVPAVQAQQPATPAEPTFRTGVNYVELPVRVVDKQGNFVRNLAKDDFHLFEDGQPQRIATFAEVDLPVPDPKKPLLESTAGPTANRPFVLHEGDSVDGRVYLFIIDDYHILPDYTFQVKSIVQNFVKKRMGPRDIAAVVYTGVNRGQDFTQDRTALVSSLSRFVGALDAMEPSGTQLVKAVAALDKIRTSSAELGRIRGRHKALVFISPTLGCVTQGQTVREARPEPAAPRPVAAGVTYQAPSAPDTTASRCYESLYDSIRVATQANVSIYSFDPTTMGSPGWVSPMIDGRGGPDAAMRQAAASRQTTVRSFDGMRVLAQETGGFTVSSVNNFDKALDRIVREHSAYYVVGYYPTNEKSDGKVRKHSVTVSRPDVQAVYRPSYTAPKE